MFTYHPYYRTIHVLSGLQLSKKILEETKVPMNPDEIWSYAVSKGYDKECGLNGKTPSRSIGARIYMDIKDGNKLFYKYSNRPLKFGLTHICYSSINDGIVDDIEVKSSYNERDLHPLLVAFIYSDKHFQAHAKTIMHEKSTKSGKNAEKWLHPDIVAAHYAFEDLDKIIVDFVTSIGESAVTLYSFELKKTITNDNVREYYFQAVSNSSWANEGYLVAPSISSDAMQQLWKLNSSFGIGVIKLDLNDVYQSEIVIPSKGIDDLDLGMMDDLVRINPDFKEFVTTIQKALKTNEVVGTHYDNVLESNNLIEYIKKKHIV